MPILQAIDDQDHYETLYGIVRDGETIGNLELEYDPDTFTIDIMDLRSTEGDINTLGIGLVREILRDLRTIFPDALYVRGFRVSGIHGRVFDEGGMRGEMIERDIRTGGYVDDGLDYEESETIQRSIVRRPSGAIIPYSRQFGGTEVQS